MSIDETSPTLRITRGRPDPEEIAALVAVLTAAGSDAPQPPPRRSAWAGRAPRDWRRSALPR